MCISFIFGIFDYKEKWSNELKENGKLQGTHLGNTDMACTQRSTIFELSFGLIHFQSFYRDVIWITVCPFAMEQRH